MSTGRERAQKRLQEKLAHNAGFYLTHDRKPKLPARQQVRRMNFKATKAQAKRWYDQAVELELQVHRRRAHAPVA